MFEYFNYRRKFFDLKERYDDLKKSSDRKLLVMVAKLTTATENSNAYMKQVCTLQKEIDSMLVTAKPELDKAFDDMLGEDDEPETIKDFLRQENQWLYSKQASNDMLKDTPEYRLYVGKDGIQRLVRADETQP